MNKPDELLDNTEEKEVRTNSEGEEIVTCPHCDADCVWAETGAGWILCDAENVGSDIFSIEDSIHYCQTRAGIEFDEDDTDDRDDPSLSEAERL